MTATADKFADSPTTFAVDLTHRELIALSDVLRRAEAGDPVGEWATKSLEFAKAYEKIETAVIASLESEPV